MRNVFFTHGTRNEQFLQQNLVEEYLKMFGMDILYIPRQLIRKDGVFNEEIISEFAYGFELKSYTFNKYKSKKDDFVQSIDFSVKNPTSIKLKYKNSS